MFKISRGVEKLLVVIQSCNILFVFCPLVRTLTVNPVDITSLQHALLHLSSTVVCYFNLKIYFCKLCSELILFAFFMYWTILLPMISSYSAKCIRQHMQILEKKTSLLNKWIKIIINKPFQDVYKLEALTEMLSFPAAKHLHQSHN